MHKLILLIFLIITACGHSNKSKIFFEKCAISKIVLKNSIVVNDSLGYFSFQVPDSSWKPQKFLNNKHNSLTVGDTSKGYIKLFSVNQSDYTDLWNWDEEQKIIERDFNVLETGDLIFHEQKCRYNIILFDNDEPQIISFYLTLLDTNNRKLYTLNLTTEKHTNYKNRLCEMKPILESFRINTLKQA